MADASHLERMGRELKCPICLSLFDSAVSLTCNHVFCNSCIRKSMKSDSSCPVCKVPSTRREVRPAPHMENLVHIYKSMESALGINMFVTQTTESSDEEKEAEGGSNTSNTKFGRTRTCAKRTVIKGKCPGKTSKTKLKGSGTKSVRPSFRTNKRVQVPKSPLPETPMHLVTSEPEGEPMNCVLNSQVPNNCSSLNGNSSHLLKPLFWLREEDAENLSQATDIEHLTLTPVNIPNFSDIKDSDDDIPDEITLGECVSRKNGVTDLFDHDMFERTQRACSPELCFTPIRNQAPSEDNMRGPNKVSGVSSEGGTDGPVILDSYDELNSPEKSHAKSGGFFNDYKMTLLDKSNESRQSQKRTRNGRIKNRSNLTKKSQQKDDAEDPGCGTVSDHGKLPTSSCAEQEHAKGMTLRDRMNSRSDQHHIKMQAKSRLPKSNYSKLDQIEVPSCQQQECEGRLSELPKLFTEVLREKESVMRVENHSASSSTGRKLRKCQEVKCKRKVDVSKDGGLTDKQGDVNVDIHAESADPMGSRHSMNAGNVVRKCHSKSNRSVCGFCHSAEETELSGEMIKYLEGKPVSSDLIGGSGIVYSHKSCTEWAPNVYFQDDIAVNLEAELTRSRRIKCSLCGEKGAALGCYDKSCRRSFHIPCAKRLRQSRWDTDNFVMLCPLHASSKLPDEQSESQVKRNNSKSTQSQAAINYSTHRKLWASHGSSDKLHLCCSALTTGEKEIVTEFKRLSGAAMSKNWNTSVTHIIASTDENGACKRTLKVLMGIMEGKWILSIEWIKACLNARKVVEESTYEIGVDTHGIKGGPRLGRLRLENKKPKIFAGFRFYLTGDFEPSYKGYLHDLIISAGGTVLHRKPIVEDQPRDKSLPSTIVVYCLELPDKNDTKKDMILMGRQAEAEALAKTSGSKAASNIWVLNCISGYTLQPMQCMI